MTEGNKPCGAVGTLFILGGTDGQEPVPLPYRRTSVPLWRAWMGAAFETGARIVGKWENTHASVSTVFIGVDKTNMPPLLFVTLLEIADFAFTMRYETWHDAEIGHDVLIRLVAAYFAVVAYPGKREESVS